jgi:glyoxylase-like metal-dependent hydrolase (beta-lactamase superfamily II)
VLALFLALSGAAWAQGIETVHVGGNVYMLVGGEANVAVQVGEDGVIVVDPGSADLADETLAAVRELSGGPIRWVVNTHVHTDHTGANTTISQAGMTVNGNPAAIIANETVLLRMSESDRPLTEWPLNTFFEPWRDFYFNGEAIFLYHFASGHTDGDIAVYFRGSDVLVSGDLFMTTTYPRIDEAADGGVDGFISGLNQMIDIAVPAWLQDGGTRVIPGHGRLGNEADLVEYRDMIVIIRDRVETMIGEGMSLDEILATEPSLDYDTRYGEEEGRAFVGAVYRRLARTAGAEE